jgi:hypothetical protein
MGGWKMEEDCNDECLDNVGCLLCIPGSKECQNGNSMICNMNGDGWDEQVCDGEQGVTCDDNSGECVGDCAPDNLGTSYIGCDYYPTVTPNPLLVGNWTFAVVVSNTSNQMGDIRIDKGNNLVQQTNVGPNSVRVISLAWDNSLKSTQNTVKVVDGAYRLRSTVPVTVYQYNPLEYTNGNSFTYTNDASILLPVNVWGPEYWIASRNTWQGYPGFYAVVAHENGTTVTLTPSATGKIVKAGAGVMANGTGNVNLDNSDVLVVASNTGGGNPDVSDLTGTKVTSDKPVQVISGHICTFIPANTGYCDHLEESMLPFDNLAKNHIVTAPRIPGGNNVKAQFVRVIATTDNTQLSYDPVQNGAPGMIATAGNYVEIGPTSNSFEIESDLKVVVVQYMQGQDAGGNIGDPAQAITVPTEQYRDGYLFHAPTNYQANFVNITAPDGAMVTLDGMAVGNWAAIGGTGYSVSRVQLANNGNGNHTISSDEDVGISVYGYGQYTSYWYPGGMDLSLIPQ